jgi:hypothetical protein
MEQQQTRTVVEASLQKNGPQVPSTSTQDEEHSPSAPFPSSGLELSEELTQFILGKVLELRGRTVRVVSDDQIRAGVEVPSAFVAAECRHGVATSPIACYAAPTVPGAANDERRTP